jgi:hypothetical protein
LGSKILQNTHDKNVKDLKRKLLQCLKQQFLNPLPQLRNTENIMYTVISDAEVLLQCTDGTTFKTVDDLLVYGLDDCVVWWKEPVVGTITG